MASGGSSRRRGPLDRTAARICTSTCTSVPREEITFDDGDCDRLQGQRIATCQAFWRERIHGVPPARQKYLLRVLKNGSRVRADRTASVRRNRVPPAAADDGSVKFRVGMSWNEVQAETLRKTLASHGGDKTAAARSLGLSVGTIHNDLGRSD